MPAGKEVMRGLGVISNPEEWIRLRSASALSGAGGRTKRSVLCTSAPAI